MSGNEAQADYWASAAELRWIEHEQALDAAMNGMLDAILDAAGLASSHRVLDIGCGTGASTIGAASRAPDGHAFGIDVSRPLLARAANRADEAGIRNVSFILGDAQVQQFAEPSFHVLISPIGMSFFSDTDAALRNFSNALVNGGRMTFVCWAVVDENPWFSIPKTAAEARLGDAPKTDPRAPGPTAFQDIEYVKTLMKNAGLIEIAAYPLAVALTPPGGANGAAEAASRVGPAARIMKAHHGSEEDAKAIEIVVAQAFQEFEEGGAVRVPAVVNVYEARVKRG